MRVVLTGATGFIGRRLAARLASQGLPVAALVRRADVALPRGVEPRPGALDDRDFLRRALADADAIIHLAGRTKAFSARGFLRVNEDLAAALAEGVARFAPRDAVLLSVSSQAAGGPCATAPGLAEDAQPAPVSQYGLSKLLGERAVLALASGQGRRVAVVRPCMVYGPGDTAFLPLYRGMARGLLPLSGPAEVLAAQRLSIIHVDDLVQGLAQALDALAQGRASGVYHMAGPEDFGWEEYAAVFGQALGRGVRRLRVPGAVAAAGALGNMLLAALGLPASHLTPDKLREGRQAGWLLDCARARRELGFAPQRTLAEGARETIAWCREQGLLPGPAASR